MSNNTTRRGFIKALGVTAGGGLIGNGAEVVEKAPEVSYPEPDTKHYNGEAISDRKNRFNSINNAINDAIDEVYLVGHFKESVVIDKPVNIIGMSSEIPSITSINGESPITSLSPSVCMTGICISESDQPVNIHGNHSRISNLYSNERIEIHGKDTGLYNCIIDSEEDALSIYEKNNIIHGSRILNGDLIINDKADDVIIYGNLFKGSEIFVSIEANMSHIQDNVITNSTIHEVTA